MRVVVLLTVFFFTLTNCTIGSYTEGTLHQISPQFLSQKYSGLRTCIFDPHYSIVHFPMYHAPPTGHYEPPVYEEVTLSQFQLLHTIIAYNRSPRWQLVLFDENITSDLYDKQFFQALSSGQTSATYTRFDGTQFNLTERMQTARNLFPQIPLYYEELHSEQKDFLYHTGASLTLYFLGEIPKIHKVISPANNEIVKANLGSANGLIQMEGNEFWIFDFREERLRDEVLSFFQKNYNQRIIILIAYGGAHDFSNEFAGYPFQSGHNFCLKWQDNLGLSQPLL